jgi:two-component system sensor histidine kinase EvgS
MEKLRQLVESRASARGLSLSLIIEKGTPARWTADRAKLDELVMNLLFNAIKYTMEGGVSLSVSASTHEDTPRLHIVVDDTGIGMPSSSLKSIFEPFTRVHDTTTHSTITGTGLGLTIVKSFADLMGGDIDITSTPGKGTRVAVTLPPGKQEFESDVGNSRVGERSFARVHICRLRYAIHSPGARVLVCER